MSDAVEVIYSEEHWDLLDDFREQAAQLMQPLHEHHIQCAVYGSIARGDVKETSDIDVFISGASSPTLIQTIIENSGIRITHREIIQATPRYAAKGYMYVDEKKGYSFPLVPLETNEEEFYRFAGSLELTELSKGVRVPGVDKRLMLIEPTEEGHIESSIVGFEGSVAKNLGVNLRIVQERVRTLKRRNKVGRTGVYLKRELSSDEGFSDVFRELALKRPALRRRMRK
jgi:predicted nucleotidyltransferase